MQGGFDAFLTYRNALDSRLEVQALAGFRVKSHTTMLDCRKESPKYNIILIDQGDVKRLAHCGR